MQETLQTLLQAIKEAGVAINQLQSDGFSISMKINNDIVTQGDLLANDILKNRLLTHFPTDGWLSEETLDDEKQRHAHARVWIVDPIDGTKEFAHHLPEYAISVALVENGIPVMSAVYNPATEQLFHAIKNQGAWLNGNKIICRPRSKENLLLLASRSEYARGEWAVFEKISQVKSVGSIAYKLALVAMGEADATFSLGPKHEWDIAAGVLLVKEAGGVVTDTDRCSFTFNQKNVKVKNIVAASAEAYEIVIKQIKSQQKALHPFIE